VGDFVLQIKKVGQVAIVSFGHDVMAGICLDQLRSDAHPAARLAHTALEHIARAQFLSDRFDVEGLAFVGKGRRAGDDRKGAPAGEHRNDVLGEAVGKELLLGIAAEVHERQDGDGASIVKSRCAGRESGTGSEQVFRQLGHLTGHPVDPDRPRDVLEVLRAEILENEIVFVDDSIMEDLRHIDTARPGQRLYPRCDVDTVTKDVALLGDDIAEIDTDPHRDALFVRQILVHLRDHVAQRGRAARGAYGVLELGEHQLRGLFEDIPIKLEDLRLDDFGQKCPEAGKTVGFIAGQQPVVAGYQDGRVTATGACAHIL